MVQLQPIISCFIKIQIGLTVLVLAYPGCPGKEAVKWVSLCQIKFESHSWQLFIMTDNLTAVH